MRIAYLILILLLSGCAAPITRSDQPAWAAVVAAETFVARHGYTSSGHPKDLPIQRVEIFDALSSLDQIAAQRHNELEPLAFGIQRLSDSRNFYVLFRMIRLPDRYGVIVVKHGVPNQVLHQSYSIEDTEWLPVQRESR